MRQSRTFTLMGLAGAAMLWGIGDGRAQYVPPPQLVPGVDYNLPNYANSPILRKFVDSLAGLGQSRASVPLGNYIPVAQAETTLPAGVPSGGNYYEIAVVDYQQQMHSDLGMTTLRGYVQIEPPGLAQPAGSQHIPLRYLDGVTPIMINGQQVYAYDQPRYLGPVIVASQGTPTRIKLYNLLPAGIPGDLFIPTDVTVMGAGMGPDGSMYPKNRATLHLHGGDNPWVSDGTAHQWITPAAEGGTLTNGVSQRNVPDMPIPAKGSATFFWPNGLSGRLMFYHDHAFGMTRLNVYAGEAAGYLLTDPTEQALNPAGGQIPLVIQDKTFVNDGNAPAGFTGIPTSATTAVDPLWDANVNPNNWGQTRGSLWFPHVYMPNQNPNDLSGANPVGRWDYGAWFWPIFPSGAPPQTSIVPEAFMDTPVVNGMAYPYLEVQPTVYRFRIVNACNDRYLNLQFYVADPTTVASDGRASTEVRMIPAVKNNGIAAGALDSLPAGAPPVPWPAGWMANDTPGMIPNILDGRAGGVPDPSPSLQGPSFIHIGSEGGIGPAPVVLDNTPIGYEQNKRSVTVLNVLEHTLFLGPAERADVIVDFSQFSGKTLIVYNDAPAPLPAGDPRYDYYTGNPDVRDSGGAPPTAAGYGPNTRTIMQIRVGGTGNGTAFDPTTLDAPVAAAFAATQPAPIVPPNTYARISDTSLTWDGVTRPLQPKTIQELFDPLGRMNATLGVELPFTSSLIQTTIPYGFADPATEVLPDGATQLWKITHNGVDTHAIHFHLFNVQLVNRVGWDGAIKPPWPEELGWKDTVKMNPLEDVVVALRAKTPTVPFTQPDNVRPLDPSMPLGDRTSFLGVGPDGNPVTVSNILANFGAEYSWHCHLLGHEENDMMRPVMVAVPPAAPLILAATVKGSALTLTWVNNATLAAGFTIQRAANNTFSSGLVTWNVAGDTSSFTDASYKANGVPYYYHVAAVSVVGSGVAGYPSITNSSAWSNLIGPPAGATVITSVAQAAPQKSPVIVKWTYAPAGDQTGFTVQRAVNSTFTSGLTTFNVNVATATSYSDGSTKAGVTYYYRVRAVSALGNGAWSNTGGPILAHQ